MDVDIEKIATRDVFGKTLVELGKKNKKIVALSADLEDATRAEYFKNEFPDRFFNLGIAEQDMAGTAVGLCLDGLIPFITSFATFLTNRAYGIIRISICYNKRNVKLIATHAGLNVGPDGATAQCLEDLAIMSVLPNMNVIVPADGPQTKKAIEYVAGICAPCYVRLSREPSPIFTDEDTPFEFGKANIVKEGIDASIIACGNMVWEALEAAAELEDEGLRIRVINMHTIKPLDKATIISAAQETGAIVTAEEHQINGGLGSMVAGVLAREFPVPMEMIAVKDTFGESGTPAQLFKKYHITSNDIVLAVKKVLLRK